MFGVLRLRQDIQITGDKDCAGVDVERPEVLTPTQFVERYVEDIS